MNPNRFYLNEAYDDETAFEVHASGPYFKRFFDVIETFAREGPRLIDGTRIEDRVTADLPPVATVCDGLAP